MHLSIHPGVNIQMSTGKLGVTQPWTRIPFMISGEEKQCYSRCSTVCTCTCMFRDCESNVLLLWTNWPDKEYLLFTPDHSITHPQNITGLSLCNTCSFHFFIYSYTRILCTDLDAIKLKLTVRESDLLGSSPKLLVR